MYQIFCHSKRYDTGCYKYCTPSPTNNRRERGTSKLDTCAMHLHVVILLYTQLPTCYTFQIRHILILRHPDLVNVVFS
jgi:hypothetical protein